MSVSLEALELVEGVLAEVVALTDNGCWVMNSALEGGICFALWALVGLLAGYQSALEHWFFFYDFFTVDLGQRKIFLIKVLFFLFQGFSD